MNGRYSASMMVLQSLICTKKPQKSLLYVTISFFTRAVFWTFCFPCMLVRTRRHTRRPLALEGIRVSDRPSSSASSADEIDVERVGGRQVYYDEEGGGNDSDSGVERDGTPCSLGVPESLQDFWSTKLQNEIPTMPWQFTAGEVRKADESVEMEGSELSSPDPTLVGLRLSGLRRGQSPDTVAMNSSLKQELEQQLRHVMMVDKPRERLEQQINQARQQGGHLFSTPISTLLATLPPRPQRCNRFQGLHTEVASTQLHPTSTLHEKRPFLAKARGEVVHLVSGQGYHDAIQTEVESTQFVPQPGHIPSLFQRHFMAGVPFEPMTRRGNERTDCRRGSPATPERAAETTARYNSLTSRDSLMFQSPRKQMRSFHYERRTPHPPVALTAALNDGEGFFPVDEGDNGMESTLLAVPTSPLGQLGPITFGTGPPIDPLVDMEGVFDPGPSFGFMPGYDYGTSWAITGDQAANNALLDDDLSIKNMDSLFHDQEARNREERGRLEWELQEKERREKELQEKREREERERQEEIERQRGIERQSIESQERQESDRRERVHRCKTCNKVYFRRCELTKHEKCHSKPFECKVPNCTSRFSLEKDLKRHKNSVHRMADKMRCPEPGCLYAEEGIARPDNLKRHMQTVHNGRNRGSEVSTPRSVPSPGSEWSEISSGVPITATMAMRVVPRYM